MIDATHQEHLSRRVWTDPQFHARATLADRILCDELRNHDGDFDPWLALRIVDALFPEVTR